MNILVFHCPQSLAGVAMGAPTKKWVWESRRETPPLLTDRSHFYSGRWTGPGVAGHSKTQTPVHTWVSQALLLTAFLSRPLVRLSGGTFGAMRLTLTPSGKLETLGYRIRVLFAYLFPFLPIGSMFPGLSRILTFTLMDWRHGETPSPFGQPGMGFIRLGPSIKVCHIWSNMCLLLVTQLVSQCKNNRCLRWLCFQLYPAITLRVVPCLYEPILWSVRAHSFDSRHYATLFQLVAELFSKFCQWSLFY